MRLRLLLFFGLAGWLAVVAALLVNRPSAEPDRGAIRIEPIRYADLAERIRQASGQAVVVDFWADYCPPCKKEFPKLVALHQKHAEDGLVCISVSLDDSADDDALKRVTKFLVNQRAAFPNYLLAERVEVWQDKLKIDGPPCVFVFDRQGRLLRKFHDDVDFAEIEKLVDGALKN